MQLMHHHYGRYQDHAVANLAVVMQREVVVWHDHSQNCGSGVFARPRMEAVINRPSRTSAQEACWGGCMS